MKNDYQDLETYIRSLYPDQEFTDTELAEMADRVVQFFTLGAKVVYRYKKDQPAATQDNKSICGPK